MHTDKNEESQRYEKIRQLAERDWRREIIDVIVGLLLAGALLILLLR